MYGDILLSTAPEIKKATQEPSTDVKGTIIEFINKLEGWKTKCKNLHWSAPKKNIHTYLDEFLSILSDYQDELAEETMGIFERFQPNVLKGIGSDTLNAIDFIIEVKDNTLEFYNSLPEDIEYSGIVSECESFIHNINKYRYLFNLCDTYPY